MKSGFIILTALMIVFMQDSFCLRLYAQKAGMNRIDSLLALVPDMPDNSEKVEVYNDLSQTYFSIDVSRGLSWGNKGLALAVKLNDRKGEAEAYNYLGSNFWTNHEYLQQQKCYFKALHINESLKDTDGIAQSIRNIGSIYESEYDYPKAIEYYKRALALAEATKNYDQVLEFQGDIGEDLKQQNKYPEALVYFEKSMQLASDLDRAGDIAAFAARAGLIESELGDFKSAVSYEEESLKIFRSPGTRNSFTLKIPWTYRDFGDVYFEKGDYSTALIYYREAYRGFMRLPGRYPKDNAGICLNGIGASYIHLARQREKDTAFFHASLHSAEDKLYEAIHLLKPNDWLTLTEALQNLSLAEQLSGNYVAALNAGKQYFGYKDSLYNTQVGIKVITNQLGYEYEKQSDSLSHIDNFYAAELNSMAQENEVAKLRSRQEKIYALMAIAASVLIILYFLLHERHAKMKMDNQQAKEQMEQQLKEAEYEKKISEGRLAAVISQMNPHFLFNALNTVQSFIVADDKKNAVSYLGKFSELTRKILDNSSKKLISLEEETELIQLYLDIEKVRFGNSLTVSLDIDPRLDRETLFLPPMLIQPYLENAIKHGLLHKPGEKNLLVKITGLNGGKEIEVMIDDNGIGREKSIEINRQRWYHNSFANSANESRIELFNRLSDKKITLRIMDKKDTYGIPEGTIVILTIPAIAETEYNHS